MIGVSDSLLGPSAALVGAIVIIGFLGRLLTQYIADLRTQRDLALAGWREQTAATNAVAAAIEARNHMEEKRLAVAEARLQAMAQGDAPRPRRSRLGSPAEAET